MKGHGTGVRPWSFSNFIIDTCDRSTTTRSGSSISTFMLIHLLTIERWRLRRPRMGSGSGATRMSHDSDRKSTRLNSSHSQISYAVFCLKKKKTNATGISRSELLPSISSLPESLHLLRHDDHRRTD